MKYIPDALFRILKKAENHPQLLVGRKSLAYLSRYIDGYISALADQQLIDLRTHWYAGFWAQVDQTYNPLGRCYDLEHTILDLGYTDETGVDFFYSLLNRFAEEKMLLGNTKTDRNRTSRQILCVRMRTTELLSLVDLGLEKDSDTTTEYDVSSDFETVTVLRYNHKDVSPEELAAFKSDPRLKDLPIHRFLFHGHVPFEEYEL